MGPETALVTGINGVPYWYFYGLEGPWRDRVVESVDPGGKLWQLLPPRQTIGSIVYPAAEVIEPGVIEHTYGNRFTLGEPDGSKSARVEALSQMFVKAGSEGAGAHQYPRRDVGEAVGQPGLQSAVGADHIDPGPPRLPARPARGGPRHDGGSARSIAEALGVKFAVSIDKRIEGAGEVGVHKTSMLQDLERGRPMEIDALLGAVVELAELTGQARAAVPRRAGAGAGTGPPGGLLSRRTDVTV